MKKVKLTKKSIPGGFTITTGQIALPKSVKQWPDHQVIVCHGFVSHVRGAKCKVCSRAKKYFDEHRKDYNL